MTRLISALSIALVLAAVPALAKTKQRTVVGCVQASGGQYALTATSKKGKARTYALRGDHNFAGDAGHRVRVTGTLAKRVLTAHSVQTVAAKCGK